MLTKQEKQYLQDELNRIQEIYDVESDITPCELFIEILKGGEIK